MSNRRAQDERIEGTPDGVNAITEIVDVPDTPLIGTATAGTESASITFTAATTGGTATTFTAISDPGSITGTSATSPITVNGLTGGTPYTFSIRGSNSTGNSQLSFASNTVTPDRNIPGSYDALASVTLSQTAGSVTFSGIPNDYEHLQVRFMAKAVTGTIFDIVAQYNGDTGQNYFRHYLYGTGSGSAAAGGNDSTSNNWVEFGYGSTVANNYAISVTDILDYSNTNKIKVNKSLCGYDANGSGVVVMYSGGWNSTAVINSMTISAFSNTFDVNSTFALYGVK